MKKKNNSCTDNISGLEKPECLHIPQDWNRLKVGETVDLFFKDDKGNEVFTDSQYMLHDINKGDYMFIDTVSQRILTVKTDIMPDGRRLPISIKKKKYGKK